MHFDENVNDLNGRDYLDEPHEARCHKKYIYKKKILSLYHTSNVNPTLQTQQMCTIVHVCTHLLSLDVIL